MSIMNWFKPAKKDALAVATEKAHSELASDQQRIVNREAELAQARVALNHSIDFAETNAAAVAARLQETINAAKAAQLEEEAEASAAIQESTEELAATLKDFEAIYRAACTAAEARHQAEVSKISGKMSADRDKLLVELDGAAVVLEGAMRTAVGW